MLRQQYEMLKNIVPVSGDWILLLLLLHAILLIIDVVVVVYCWRRCEKVAFGASKGTVSSLICGQMKYNDQIFLTSHLCIKPTARPPQPPVCYNSQVASVRPVCTEYLYFNKQKEAS